MERYIAYREIAAYRGIAYRRIAAYRYIVYNIEVDSLYSG